VQAYLDDLQALLARREIERGKDLLASLGTKVLIAPDGLVEIQGNLAKALLTTTAGSQRDSVVSWLGEPAFSELHAVRTRYPRTRDHGGVLGTRLAQS
jgi:hypothetical protein